MRAKDWTEIYNKYKGLWVALKDLHHDAGVTNFEVLIDSGAERKPVSKHPGPVRPVDPYATPDDKLESAILQRPQTRDACL